MNIPNPLEGLRKVAEAALENGAFAVERVLARGVLALLSELEAVKGENASLKASRELAPTTCRGDGQEAATVRGEG